MSYVGNPLATAFAPRVKQDLTGQSGTSFTLSHAVSSANDLSVYINHVRQEPTTAYTVDYTTLTTTGSVASTDDFYIIFDELALQSIAHDEFTAMKATSGTFTGAITTTQMASSGPVSGTTGTFSGAISGTLGTASQPNITSVGTLTGLTSNTSGGDANSTSDLSGDFGTWMRVGDGVGNKTMSNGSGLKIADAGVAHWTVGQLGGIFRISRTSASKDELFPSFRNDYFSINGSTGVTSLTSATVSGDLTVDTSTLKVDSSNNRVGIGTASPAFNTEISNSSTSTSLTGLTDAQLVLVNTGTATANQFTKLGFRFADGSYNGQAMIAGVRESATSRATALALYSAPSSDGDPDERVRINSSGNVGIANNTPLVKLDVTGSNAVPATSGTSQTGALRLGQSSGNGVMDMGFQTTNSVGWIQPTNKANLATNYNLVLNPNGGNVGVGPSTNPNTSIHVKQATPAIKLEETSSGGSKMIMMGVEADGTPYIDAPQSGGNIEFKCVGVPAMQITRTGDTNNPAEFRIKCGSGSLHQCITGTNWGYSTGYEAFMLGRDDTASEGTFSFGYNPRVNANGGFTGDGREVIFRRGMKFVTPNAANNGWYNQFTMTDGVTSGDFNDTSDEKLKENIKDIDGGLSVINKLRPVNFDWKDKGKGNGLGGFIAQEVQKILPNDVMGEEYIESNREKNIEGTEGLSINSTSIIAHLVKAVQELEAKVKILENK